MLALALFLIGWLFVLGSATGSFLNVVVWRLPLHMSLSRPASHCPKCGHPIRWWHNVPILGWLWLRGKCYDCKAPISKRYPLVEFTCALAFVIPAFYAIVEGLILLTQPEAIGARSEIVDDVNNRLAVIFTTGYVLDVLLFLTTLAVGLIQLDGMRVPRRLLIPYGVALVAAYVAYYGFDWGLPLVIAPHWNLLFALPSALVLAGVGWSTDPQNRSALLLLLGCLLFAPNSCELMAVAAILALVLFPFLRKKAMGRALGAFTLLLVPLFQIYVALAIKAWLAG